MDSSLEIPSQDTAAEEKKMKRKELVKRKKD